MGAALAGVGVPVHINPPQALQPPCVVLQPGSPWIRPRGQVTIDVVAFANPAGGTSSALDRLETLVENIRGGLFAAGLAPGDTEPPRTETDAGVLSATTPTTLRTTCH